MAPSTCVFLLIAALTHAEQSCVEESSAGAFYGAPLTPGAAAVCLTPADESLPALQSGALPAGAGKVRGAAFGPDGTLVLHANFSVTHPVTAACGLWRLDWPAAAGSAPSRERLTAEGLEVSSFGWADDGSGPALWATAIEGVSRRSFVVGGDDIGASICTNVAYSASGAAVFGKMTRYISLGIIWVAFFPRRQRYRCGQVWMARMSSRACGRAAAPRRWRSTRSWSSCAAAWCRGPTAPSP